MIAYINEVKSKDREVHSVTEALFADGEMCTSLQIERKEPVQKNQLQMSRIKNCWRLVEL